VRGVFRGLEGWIEFAEWLRSGFESPRAEIKLTDAGDQVLAEAGNRSSLSLTESPKALPSLPSSNQAATLRGGQEGLHNGHSSFGPRRAA
jgi:hypothetical protein